MHLPRSIGPLARGLCIDFVSEYSGKMIAVGAGRVEVLLLTGGNIRYPDYQCFRGLDEVYYSAEVVISNG